MPRFVILTEGHSEPERAKTATALLRYRPEDVAAILDSERAGETAEEVFGVGGAIPVVGRLSEAKADALLIGIAPAGGALPPEWRKTVREAIRRGLDVVSGLHAFLSEDPEFRRLAAQHEVRLVDLRRPPERLTVSADLARRTRCHRVHTVGHDCSVGKMVAAVEIARALERRGKRAEFVATGQTGILLAGWGVPVDRIVSDFVAGAIETAILERQDREFLVIEGQGSLVHPFYSGVTLSLLHGCAPQTLVMVFDPTRKAIRHTDRPMPPLSEVVRIYEEMASVVEPSRVVAVAANTYKLSADEARAAVRRAEEELGIPAADVIRDGPERIVEAVLERHEELGLGRPARPPRRAARPARR